MDSRIVQRLFRGFGASLYGQVVVVVIQLAGVPVLLSHWHASLYGEWLILFAIPAYLSLSDLGFSQSAANDMTARVARGDKSGALTVFQSLGALAFSTAGTGMLLVAAATSLLPLENWLHLSSLTVPEVRWILWLLAAEILVKLTEGVSHAGFRATGDYALHVTIYYSTLLVQHASVWTLASLGKGPVAAAAAFFVIRAIVTPAVAVLLVRRHSWLHFGFGHARLAELKALLRPAVANTGLPLAQALNVQGMVLLVGAVLGPIAVVTFSTLRTLTRFVFQLVVTVSNASEPELAAAFGSGNLSLLRTLYQHTIRAGFWLAFTAALGLALTGTPVLRFWTNGHVSMDLRLFHWLLISAVASVLWYGNLTALKSANRHLLASVVFVGSAGVALALAAVLLRATGNLASAGMSLLIVDVMMAVGTTRMIARLFQSQVLNSLFASLNPLPLVRALAR